MKLALDGGMPVRTKPWPAWPPPLDHEQRKLVTEVLESGLWGATQGGGVTEDLMAALAAKAAVPYGIAVGNATLGLFAALRGLGIGPGDEVIVPAYTFVASATSVILAGATPVIVDVDPVDLHLSASAVEAAITPKSAAIMPVHLAGSPADMDDLAAVAVRHGLKIVEDAAQAHGATYGGRPVGGLGDAGVFSFQASKAMTAGEGGAIVCPDESVYEAIWSVCNLGRRRGGQWYGHPELGWNLRMTEIQSALLLPWLDRLEGEIDRREAFCAALDLDGLPVSAVPQPPGTTRDSRHLLMLRIEAPVDKERLLAAMAAEGVPLSAGYPPLGTIEGLGARAGLREESALRVEECPGADQAARDVVWLPQPMLMADPAEAADVAEAFRKVLS